MGGRCVFLEFTLGSISLSSLKFPFGKSPEQPSPSPKLQEKQASLWAILSRLTRHDHKGAPKSFHYFCGAFLCCMGRQLKENSVNLEEGMMLEGKAEALPLILTLVGEEEKGYWVG